MRASITERKREPILLPYRGAGRPQVVLIGNGLERVDDKKTSDPCGAKGKPKSWDKLLEDLTVENHLELAEGDLADTPFPLKYHLLATERDAPYPLLAEDRKRESDRLSAAVVGLGTVTNPALRRLPDLLADHYFTTNYTYSLERAFYPKRNFQSSGVRDYVRFNYNAEPTASGKRQPELYRLYTGYLAKLPDGGPTCLWHIHGECGAAGSIILGHDGYGRLLSRIVPVCADEQKYHDIKTGKPFGLRSWPELFLFADVYILGLGLGVSEFDLMWLLRRKQREDQADGRVYFYTNDNGKPEFRDRNLMLRALGVQINPDGIEYKEDHADFYEAAQNSIQARIAENRKARTI